MTTLKKIALCALLALPAPLCRADTTPAPAGIGQAEKLFQSGEGEKARQAYAAELAHQGNPELLPPSFFFNYGTIAAKAGALGAAYVLLERAAFAMPFDSDTKHNLRFVETQLPASVLSVQPSQWMGWWPHSLRELPWKLWALIALLFSGAAFALSRAADRTLTWFAGSAAALLFLFTAAAWQQARMPVYGAVALAKVKSGPGTTFSDITSLEPGSLVNEETTRDGWLKIRFVKPGADDETVGWVEPGGMLRVL